MTAKAWLGNETHVCPKSSDLLNSRRLGLGDEDGDNLDDLVLVMPWQRADLGAQLPDREHRADAVFVGRSVAQKLADTQLEKSREFGGVCRAQRDGLAFQVGDNLLAHAEGIGDVLLGKFGRLAQREESCAEIGACAFGRPTGGHGEGKQTSATTGKPGVIRADEAPVLTRG